MTTKAFQQGDKVQHTAGPTGTVLKVFPSDTPPMALVGWDNGTGPGKLIAKESHVYYFTIEKVD